jgi:uncharacterized protein (TIGR02646 family)
MKHILKGGEPASFQRWKRQNPHEANWSLFSGSVEYQELKEVLIEQQSKMCCYCEIALKQNTNAHIEHLKDRHNWPNEIFNYANLLASCNGSRNDSCGHKKGTNYFVKMVSPLSTGCESRFTYTGIGKMIPLDESDKNAQKTIELLGLNCKRLRDRRKAIIRTLEDAGSGYLQQYLDKCVDWYGFFTVIKYVVDRSN